MRILKKIHSVQREIEAKLYKTMGRSMIARVGGKDADWKNIHTNAETIATALRYLKNILALHGPIGVKKEVQRLEHMVAGWSDEEQPGGTQEAAQSVTSSEQVHNCQDQRRKNTSQSHQGQPHHCIQSRALPLDDARTRALPKAGRPAGRRVLQRKHFTPLLAATVHLYLSKPP